MAVLGATGAVGQRFVSLLVDHPWFEIASLTASERSVGQRYEQVCDWRVTGAIPEAVANLEVAATDAKQISPEVEIVFSAIPAEIAGEIENDFAKEGFKVFSNARSNRMEPDVPLVVGEVNADHFALLKTQQRRRRFERGFIVTNPNCSTIMMVMVLKPLQEAFGIKKVVVSTMQALSGAGYPGVSSLDILDNVLPFIGGEEEKMESESVKLLGTFNESQIDHAKMAVSASCHRVAVRDGHLEDVHIELGREASIEEVKRVLAGFTSWPQKLDLPSAPARPIVVREEDDRPQPRMDRDAGAGMTVTVGRVRRDSVMANGVKMEVLGHNTIRGAAGASILNAEFYLKKLGTR